MRSFTVIAASKDVKLDAKGNASVTFTVTNTNKNPVRGTPKLKPLGSTGEAWLKMPSGGTRNFSPNESQQFVVEIAVPPASKAGEYSFGLNISNESLPDEDFTEGPAVAFKVPELREPNGKPKPFPWWILIVIGVVLVGGGVTIAILLKPSKQTVPNVVDKPISEASNLLAQAQLRSELAKTLATGKKPIGTVIEQDPPAGQKIAKDSVVKLTVEQERSKVAVPRVIDLPFSRLKELFGSLGLEFVDGQKRFDSPKPPGTILDQTPKESKSDDPSTWVDPGSRVTLTVATEGVEVPDVSSKNLEVRVAVNTIVGSKLTVNAIDQKVTTATQSWDRVIDQDPKPGGRIAPNSPVTLFVGVRSRRPVFNAVQFYQIEPRLMSTNVLRTIKKP